MGWTRGRTRGEGGQNQAPVLPAAVGVQVVVAGSRTAGFVLVVGTYRRYARDSAVLIP